MLIPLNILIDSLVFFLNLMQLINNPTNILHTTKLQSWDQIMLIDKIKKPSIDNALYLFTKNRWTSNSITINPFL
jgi:hypothetical protein